MTRVRLARSPLVALQRCLPIERSPALGTSETWSSRVLLEFVLSQVTFSSEGLCADVASIAFDASKAVEVSLQVAFSGKGLRAVMALEPFLLLQRHRGQELRLL